MGKKGEKLNKKQELAVLAILTEPNMEKAAEKAGIAISTLYRWQQLDSFKERLRLMRHEIISQATTKLRQGMNVAVITLIELAQNTDTQVATRASASRTLLEFGFKAYELENLQERIEELEKGLG
ncbi:hypothetical protein [Halobacillus yeomjeoni]|uniref:Homeodomain phBC6A51-type domain-containing protein n=1 Tax=Halobacillus yeomjeoni TaxID=311194 RepID=A0A931MTD7_9BACI|nr:hypothetical protein [Halobacillus yeomjeoni]MBH0228838.1 hypothetical protein [Halobacillus yeomjeoni]